MDPSEFAAQLDEAARAVVKFAPIGGKGELAIPISKEGRVLRTYQPGGGGSKAQSDFEVAQPQLVLLSQWSRFAALPEVARLRSSALAEACEGLISSPERFRNHDLEPIDFLVATAIVQAIRCGSRGHDPVACNVETASRLVNSLSTSEQVQLVVAPLYNFISGLHSPIALPWGVVLRRLTVDEMDEISNPNNVVERFRPQLPVTLETFVPTWALAGEVHTEWNHGPKFFEILPTFEMVLSILRLLRPEKVAMAGVTSAESPSSMYGTGSTDFSFPPVTSWIQDSHQFELDGSLLAEAQGLLRPFSRLAESELSGPLGIALGRLDDVSRRHSEADLVIDAVVAMEALLLSSSPQERTYRFALSGALLLGDTPRERAELLAALKRAYGLRSRIVHSGTGEGRDYAGEIVGLARRTVKRVLLLSETLPPSKVPRLLADYVISGSPETIVDYARHQAPGPHTE